MTKQQRTEALLKGYKGIHDEFTMLKGVLCMVHYNDVKSGNSKEWEKENAIISIFDNSMISTRLDEINKRN